MAKATIKVGKTLQSKTRKFDKVNVLLNSLNLIISTIILLKLFEVI